MFELDLKSRKSIYEQVIDNLKAQIVSGALAPGDKLPSVRELSKRITVNPNTVQKAYRELERAGYIYTTAGVGTFIADRDSIRPDAQALARAREGLAEAFRQFLYLGLPYDQAKEMAIRIIEEGDIL